MTPTTVLNASVNGLVAADTTKLASATALKVHLIQAPFTPGADTSFGDLTEATFTGATAKSPATGAQQAFFDPVAGSWVVQLTEPAGGWHWVTTDAVSLPQTVYGYAVTNGAGSVTFGSALLDNPVNLVASGDAVDIGFLRFTLPISPLG